MKCKCPPGSPFHWHEDPRPSIFLKDKSAALSRQATSYVDSERAQNRDSGNIPGLTTKERFLQPRRFVIFSKA